MSAVNVTAVRVQNNPAAFLAPLAFEIEYECLTALADDLEWRMTYVGSAESENYDQVLDSVLVGPVHAGNYRFVFEGNPPDATRLPLDDVVGVTVILLTCSYHGKEFIRIGYYVNSEYVDEELRENPPERPIIERLSRRVLADHPRVTRFPVDFDAAPSSTGVAGEVADGVGCDTPMQDPGMEDSQAFLQQQGATATAAAAQQVGSSFGQLSMGNQFGQQQPLAPPAPGLVEGMHHEGIIGAY